MGKEAMTDQQKVSYVVFDPKTGAYYEFEPEAWLNYTLILSADETENDNETSTN